MMGFLREPLLHFFVLGAALFGLYGLVDTKEAEQPAKISVSAVQIANLRDGFARTWQRPPTAQELEGLIEDHIRSEIYAREARALGLDRDDIVIRRRLRQKMEFFAEDMAASAPSDAELGAYYAAHPEQFRSEDSMTFRHVFLSATRRESVEKDAQEVAVKLAGTKDGSGIVSGDPFLLGDRFRGLSQSEVVRTFGERFAEKLFVLEPGLWQGPIRSSYGLHFVFVEERLQGTLPPLEAIRAAVEREWANTRRVEKLEEIYNTLRQRYDISIERPPPGREAQATGAVQ